MEREFWLERWQAGQIGFHQADITTYLIRHWPRLRAAPGERVLVPLCGKSLDLRWLAEQGHSVLGVELSSLAVDAFFAENALDATRSANDAFATAESGPIALWCGDFFDLTPEHTQGIACVYDRAALIALPPPMRQRYAEHLKRLLPSGARILLLTVEYAQEAMSGPPFAVLPDEVASLYAPQFDVERLETSVLPDDHPLRARGVSPIAETTFVLTKR